MNLDRRLMAQWMGRVGFELEILADHVLGEILKGARVFADETSLPALAPVHHHHSAAAHDRRQRMIGGRHVKHGRPGDEAVAGIERQL